MSVAMVQLTGDALRGIDPTPRMQAFASSIRQEVVCLGRVRPKAMPATLMLDSYFKSDRMTAALPSATNYRAKAKDVIARMYLNDRMGCCVISGKWHLIGSWTANDDPAGGVQCTDAEILRDYHTICGPGDNGCIITNVLDVMRTRGLLTAGKYHKIDGYVSFDWLKQQLTKVAIYIGGGLTIGVNLPEEWTQAAIWDVTSSRIVGGHDVSPIDFGLDGVYVMSWGRIYLITWAAWLQSMRRWVEECYFRLSPDWYGSDKLSPCGIDAAMLQTDMAKISRGEIPDIEPPTPIPPVPPPIPPTPNPQTETIITLEGSLTPGSQGSYRVT